MHFLSIGEMGVAFVMGFISPSHAEKTNVSGSHVSSHQHPSAGGSAHDTELVFFMNNCCVKVNVRTRWGSFKRAQGAK